LGRGWFQRSQGEGEAGESSPGLRPSDLLALPETPSATLGEGGSGLLHWMVRQGKVSFAEVSTFLGQDDERTRALLADLQDRGFVCEIEVQGQIQYGVRLARKRAHTLPSDLWQALEDKPEQGGEEPRGDVVI